MTAEAPVVEAEGAGSSGRRVLLEARHIVQEFAVRAQGGIKGGVVNAVSDVSFDVMAGETLGLVGETGAGKSTLANSILMTPRPISGEVRLDGTDLMTLNRRELRLVRRNLQMVYQDAFSSVDPRWRVEEIVEEPLLAHRTGNADQRRRRVNEVLDLVGLEPALFGSRRPRQLSGGQCQRVAIARALALSPALIVCDEAVSSLDVLIQAQILSLLEDLRREFQLSYLFVAHDLALLKQVSDRVAVMYLGRFCELGPAEAIYSRPLHPYTAALLSSIPSPDPNVPIARVNEQETDDIPSPIDPPSGCRYRTRCPRAAARCAVETPELRPLAGREVACHFPLLETPLPSVDAP